MESAFNVIHHKICLQEKQLLGVKIRSKPLESHFRISLFYNLKSKSFFILSSTNRQQSIGQVLEEKDCLLKNKRKKTMNVEENSSILETIYFYL